MRTDIPVEGQSVKIRLLADHMSHEIYGWMRRVESLRGVAVGRVTITSKEVKDAEGDKHHKFMFSDQTRLLKGKRPKELPQDLTPETKEIGQRIQAWEGQVTGRYYIDLSPEGTLTRIKEIREKVPVEEGTL